MDKKAKFENFLGSLKGRGQDNLIENIKMGFEICMESSNDSYDSGEFDWDNPVESYKKEKEKWKRLILRINSLFRDIEDIAKKEVNSKEGFAELISGVLPSAYKVNLDLDASDIGLKENEKRLREERLEGESKGRSEALKKYR